MANRRADCRYRLAAWLLVILLTALAVMREGLHAIPGMGHAIRVGDRVVLLGVRTQPRKSTSPVCSLVSPGVDLARLLDPAACPLCRLLGIPFLATVSGTATPAELQARLPAPAPAGTESPIPDFYLARGPPRA